MIGVNKWPEKSRLAILLAALILWGMGCRSPLDDNGSPPVAPVTITCHLFYRDSQAVPPGPETTLILKQHGDRESASFEMMEFSVRYLDDQFEGRSLFIAVNDADGGQQLSGQLYQMDRQQGTQNQFQGGHGFTGLAYIYHPDTGAELQYFCEVQSSGP